VSGITKNVRLVPMYRGFVNLSRFQHGRSLKNTRPETNGAELIQKKIK